MSSVIINPDKTISIDGKKTFPIGMWGICNEWDTMVAEKSPTPEPCLITVNKLKNNFLFAMGGISGTAPDYGDSSYVKAYEDAGIYWLASPRQTTNLQSPYFGGWTHYQEPKDFNQWWNTCPIDDWICKKAWMKLKYTEMKTKSNYPVFLNIMGKMYHSSPSSLKYWQDCCDIVVTDGWESFLEKYPKDTIIFRYEQTHYDTLFWDISGNVNNLTKPVVIGTVAMGRTGSMHLLTEKELRLHNYVAITMGASGIFYWGYKIWLALWAQFGLSASETQFAIFDRQASELKSLNDILVLPTESLRWMSYKSNDIVTMTTTYPTNFDYWGTTKTDTNFNWILKNNPTTKVKYLIVVNKGMQSITSTIKISSIGGTVPVITLGNQTVGSGKAGRIMTATNGTFTDTFDSQTVHIYQLTEYPCPKSQCDFTITYPSEPFPHT